MPESRLLQRSLSLSLSREKSGQRSAEPSHPLYITTWTRETLFVLVFVSSVCDEAELGFPLAGSHLDVEEMTRSINHTLFFPGQQPGSGRYNNTEMVFLAEKSKLSEITFCWHRPILVPVN